MSARAETELFAPVKRFLEAQGYSVRAEVKSCDVVAVRDETLVIVELKRSFNIDVLLQGVERLKLSDNVYVAVESSKRLQSRRAQTAALCRRLGLGLLLVSFGRRPRVEVLCDPGPYKPRLNKVRQGALLREFLARSANHNVGGSNHTKIVTAYREQALALADYLGRAGPTRVALMRTATGVERAGAILQKNYYGWFQRIKIGTYALTPTGERALERYAHVLNAAASEGAAAPNAAGSRARRDEAPTDFKGERPTAPNV